jgi:hypothetical protein
MSTRFRMTSPTSAIVMVASNKSMEVMAASKTYAKVGTDSSTSAMD